MLTWQFKFGLPLALALTCLVGPTVVWSAEKVVSKSPTVTRPKIRPQAGTSKTGSDVIPVSFSSVAEIQDSTIDECEAVRDRAHHRASRLYRESLIARCHRYEREKIRLEHENSKDWFNYIRGYGPVVWVRNGPEMRWHPPSIPFAKRVGGATVRHWEGVTDIPSQPDISPRRVNQIHAREMRYRNQE